MPSERKKIRGCPPTKAKELSKVGTKSGFLLLKQNEEWNRKYCVIKPSTFLFYYNSEADKYPAGVVDLEYYTKVNELSDDSSRFEMAVKHRSSKVTSTLKSMTFKVDPGSIHQAESERLDWVEALREDRFKVVVSQRDNLNSLHSDLSEKLRISERASKSSKKKLAEITRKAKLVVESSMKQLEKVNNDDDNDDDDQYSTESFEAIEKHLDIVSCLEKLREVTTEMSNRLTQQQKELETLRLEKLSIEDDEDDNTPSHLDVAMVAELESLRKENLQLREDMRIKDHDMLDKFKDQKDQMEVLQQQVKTMRADNVMLSQTLVQVTQKAAAAESASSSRSKSPPAALQRRGKSLQDIRQYESSSSSAPSKAKGAWAGVRAMRSKLTRQTSTASDSSDDDQVESLPDGWSKKESKHTPGMFYYHNEHTGEQSWRVPTGTSAEYYSSAESDSSGSSRDSQFTMDYTTDGDIDDDFTTDGESDDE